MRKIFWKTYELFFTIFFPSLKHYTKDILDGEHLVDWRSWLTRVRCIGSCSCDAMPFRTGPHLRGWPQEPWSRNWCPSPIEGLPRLYSCLATEFPDQFFNCPMGSWNPVLEVIQSCSEARHWRQGEVHLKRLTNTPPCEGHSSPELWIPVWGWDEHLPGWEVARPQSLCSLRLTPHLSSSKVSKTI